MLLFTKRWSFVIVLATLAGLTQNLTTAGGITGGTAGGVGAICAVSCEPPAPFCRGGTCRTQCQSDEECQKFSSPKPFCTSGNCYENCGAGAFCSVISSAHQKCDTTSGRCVECVCDDDCPDRAAPKCSDGVCSSCQTADDCEHLGYNTCFRPSGECRSCSTRSDCTPLAPVL